MPFHPIIVLTSPSGAGKTSIAHRVLAEIPDMRFSVSATTRERRRGEKEGVDYHFLSKEAFKQSLENDELLEYEEVYPDLYYGTLRSDVVRGETDPPAPVLLDIDVKGARNVKDLAGEAALTIFIQPPSLKELERRLRGRGTESRKTMGERLVRAEMEMTYADRSDVIIVNDNLDAAVNHTLEHITRFLHGVTP